MEVKEYTCPTQYQIGNLVTDLQLQFKGDCYMGKLLQFQSLVTVEESLPDGVESLQVL